MRLNETLAELAEERAFLGECLPTAHSNTAPRTSWPSAISASTVVGLYSLSAVQIPLIGHTRPLLRNSTPQFPCRRRTPLNSFQEDLNRQALGPTTAPRNEAKRRTDTKTMRPSTYTSILIFCF